MIRKLLTYGAFQVVVLISSLLTMLYVTKMVTPEDYSIYGIFLSLAALTQPFSSLSTERLIQVNRHKLEAGAYSEFYAQVTLVTYLCSGLIIMASLFYYFFISSEVFVLYACGIVGFRAIKTFKLNEYTVDNKAVSYGMVGVAVRLLTFSLVYAIFENSQPSTNSFILSVFIAEAVVALVINSKVFFKLSIPSKEELRTLLNFGIPLVISALPAWVAHESGRLILSYYSPLESGLLTLSIQVATIYMVFNTALGNSIVKDVYANVGNKKLTYITIKTLIIQLVIAVLFMLVFFSFYESVIDEKFHSIDSSFYFLILAFLVQSCSLIPIYLSSYEHKTSIVLKANISAAIVYLIGLAFAKNEPSAFSFSIVFLLSMLAYSLYFWRKYYSFVFISSSNKET